MPGRRTFKTKSKSSNGAKLAQEVHRLLNEIYLEIHSKRYSGVLLSTFAGDVAGTFSDDSRLKFPGCRRGKTVFGRSRYEAEEYHDVKISTYYLTPIYRDNELVAFEFAHAWESHTFEVDYSEYRVWVIAKEPLKFRIVHRSHHRDVPAHWMYLEGAEEEKDAIVDQELFELCKGQYEKALELVKSMSNSDN